jgi:hypothetical protein
VGRKGRTCARCPGPKVLTDVIYGALNKPQCWSLAGLSSLVYTSG